MRLFVDNLMSHKVAFAYYSYFDMLNFVIHTLNIPFITFRLTPLAAGDLLRVFTALR